MGREAGRSARRAAVVGLLLGLGAGCGGAEPAVRDGAGAAASPSSARPATPAVPAVPGIDAEAIELRTDAAVGGQVHVRITNTGAEPFTVTSLALRSPGFEPLPAGEEVAGYAPGRTIDLPAPYGDPVCDADAEPATVELTVARPDGTTERLTAPLAAEALTRVHGKRCAALALAGVVDVAVTGLRADEAGVSGSLTLERRSGTEPVRVVRLDRSVLVEPTASGLPLDLGGDERSAATPVSFEPASCDPHVLAETKQPFRFPVGVEVGEREPVVVDLPLDEPARAQLTEMVDRICTGRR
ncbi:hypothetical protein OF117_13190 [Geodermatophilus sp. YIM 151500]|uniref:hypothetical protein n=1 Tax=Geodermatophilus sp. YIM 151500 TaxID=2984531 RepID=UPI0021E3853F|nr:hypothetical protein [Geodermatophilus sp. YIM 151500]MCV2490318.1 hypothetical protein [Geodermatophilus sp. YIM 151500]